MGKIKFVRKSSVPAHSKPVMQRLRTGNTRIAQTTNKKKNA